MKTERKAWIVAAVLGAVGLALLVTAARSEPVYVDGCSGTYIGEGYVLTAGHCVDRKEFYVSKVNPEMKGNENTEKFSVKVIWSSPLDIAVVRLDKAIVKTTKQEREADEDRGKTKQVDISAIPFTATKIGCSVPKVGDTVVTKGWPSGEYTEVSGTIASKIGSHVNGLWPASIIMQSAGYFGSSGSGVVNSNGEVTAVLVGSHLGSGLIYIIPASEICNVVPREIK